MRARLVGELETVVVGASPSAAQTLAVVVHVKGSRWPLPKGSRCGGAGGASCVRNVPKEFNVTCVASVTDVVKAVVWRA